MKKFLVVLLLITPAFASFHYVGRTLKPTGQAAYAGAKASGKLASYPVRHPKKTVKGVTKGFTSAVKTAL
jgi:hypothetical protein